MILTKTFPYLFVRPASLKNQQDDRRYHESAYRITDDCEAWWDVFQEKNLQHFVSSVTSKNGYLKVNEKLQTLQAINDARTRHVVRMQQTIRQLINAVNEDQQVMTALKFRYLLENLRV